jgi:POT family proton-dependent oligopeptide transporter
MYTIYIKQFGYAWAFGVPGVLMGIATVIFVAGRNKFVRKPPTGIKKKILVP